MKSISTVKNEAVLRILEEIKEEISMALGDAVKEIILYGSYARDEQTEFSDVDIAVLVDDDNMDMPAIKDKLGDIKVDLSLKYDVVISIIIKKYRQFIQKRESVPFYSVIHREGIALSG
jgi:predicted nucleotidyltransferase